MTETRQRRIQSFAFVVSVWICVVLTAGVVASSFMRYSSTLGGCEIELDDKINPNDAPAASLIRLPGLGMARATAIVAYRENFSNQEPDSPVFQSCEDLRKVKGVGPKTVQNISQWLKFE